MNEIDTILKKTYFETVFDPPEMSQNEDRQLDSLIFPLQSTIFHSAPVQMLRVLPRNYSS